MKVLNKCSINPYIRQWDNLFRFSIATPSWGPESVLGGPVYVICGATVVSTYLFQVHDLQF